jgi:hypothetical protein
MDADERRALLDEGLDPDDPRVASAIDLVRWELSMMLGAPHTIVDGWIDGGGR